MCGIVGGVSTRNIVPFLLKGLKKLEYRGYDSAGVAALQEGNISVRRVKGKVSELIELVKTCPLEGYTGIAHTRWATHGEPSEKNAHPHISHDQIAIVHNGIIENYEELKETLKHDGYTFRSETDTEVVAHLIHYHLLQKKDLLSAVQEVVTLLKGAYALGIIDKKSPHRLIAVRAGSPLVIGLGNHENFIASDNLALMPITQSFIYLEEGDIADISIEHVAIFDAQRQQVERKIYESELELNITDKGHYRHYMLKEIFEQPQAIVNTLEGRISRDHVLENVFGNRSETILEQVEHIQIVACGTSYHAGLVAAYWLEEFAKIPCKTEIASEYRYRKGIVQPNTLFISISQSGETADTLAALRLAKTKNYLATLAICNVPESYLVRESDLVFMTRAGIEIGVASTKAFTTQLIALLLLTLKVARKTSHISYDEEQMIVKELLSLPSKIEKTLELDRSIQNLAKQFIDKNHALFLGRGIQYATALEGALKLKEISYIHAEAYPAGELKHGPLALVDQNMPVIAIAPNDMLFEKLKSNLHEVMARGGKLIVFANDEQPFVNHNNGTQILLMPVVHPLLSPILYTIPLQLLAYHVAVIKGTDVDQPRNLAKSVTVE